jgi:transcriptional regulator with XRE-family HTH domain
MLSININTPDSVMQTLKENFKNKRLSSDLTQEGLANKSGVSLGSLKRFESTGQISLESLLKLAVILECLEDFLYIAQEKKKIINSIDELLEKKESVKKQRGRKK